MTPENTLLICGLPESGKTTFLGALSYLMTSREIETMLAHGGLPSERAYMNQLADRWCQCDKMERTRYGEEESVTLNFIQGEIPLEIRFPDLSGETWKQVWEHHQCSIELAKLASEANGIVIFIHADTINKPLSVIHAKQMADAISGPSDLTDQTPSSHAMEVTETAWSPSEHTPTQAILTALLQLLCSIHSGEKKEKVAIVLSAWDTVENTTPKQFIENELPLLYQFLESRFYYNDWKAFGVSAQGGDLDSPDSDIKNELLSMDKQSERIKIQTNESSSHDLTKILDWALS
jgi:hypothetical protein